MTKDNATPRPWKVYAPDRPLSEFIKVCEEMSKDQMCFEARIITNMDDSEHPDYRVLAVLGNGPKAEANAELIIKAVNRDHVFDELVEVLKTIKNHPEYSAFYSGIPSKITNKIEQALKKASE